MATAIRDYLYNNLFHTPINWVYRKYTMYLWVLSSTNFGHSKKSQDMENKPNLQMGLERMILRYAFHRPLMVNFPDKCEWQTGFNPNKDRVIWYMDGTKTSTDTGAGVQRWAQESEAKTLWNRWREAKPEGKMWLGRPGHWWENSIKWIFREQNGCVDWIDLTQYRSMWQALVYVAMNLQIPYAVGTSWLHEE